MGSWRRTEWKLPPVIDLQKGRLFLYSRNGDTKIIIIGLDAEGSGRQRGNPRSDLVITDRPKGHFCRIARIEALGNETQRPHAIPSNHGQQIKDTGTIGMLALGYFFSYGAIIRQ